MEIYLSFLPLLPFFELMEIQKEFPFSQQLRVEEIVLGGRKVKKGPYASFCARLCNPKEILSP
jgi:hypothetical protein